ncbi:hypothetical protein AB0K60_02110 [Thermopolyspora sp. NPDC052614]|uniref:hypothetical protein n=1 Tax=Thermopolyspora sp. NPDC052614 TaxID=3155682 RepID=UPI00342DC1A6
MRIAAYAAVPLVLAGGIVAVRAWHPGGEAGVASPPPAFAARSAPTSAEPEAGAGKAEAASDDAVPRPEPSPSGESESGQPDAKKPGEKKSDTKKSETKKSDEKSGEESGEESGEKSGEESGDDAATGESGGGGVVEPVGEADAAGLAGLLVPEIGATASDEPGTEEPSDKSDKSDGAEKQPSGKAVPGHSKHTDGEALGYFLWRWGQKDAAIKRITDIRTVGGYLRIYTKLPDTAVNSRHAVKLCERGREYLSEERGVRHPVVFVHARAGLNGNPVLANDLGKSDKNCRLTTPRPG